MPLAGGRHWADELCRRPLALRLQTLEGGADGAVARGKQQPLLYQYACLYDVCIERIIGVFCE